MIKFLGVEIPGPHTSLLPLPPTPVFRDTHFPGVNGLSQIFLGQSGRQIQCDIWLSDKTWQQAGPVKLFDEIDRLDSIVGENGRLEELGTMGRSFDECTFLGFFPTPLQGQAEPGPITDEAMTLFDYGNNRQGGAWVQAGKLLWVQLVL